MKGEKHEIKISFPQELQGGRYANNMHVTHTKEEFVMDFMMVVPPAGAITARVIVSPGHMKRISNAILDNIKKYEEKYGTLEEAAAPMGSLDMN